MNALINSLRQSQTEIREKIKHYKEFYKGLSLMEIMEVTKSFIENQSEDFYEINSGDLSNQKKVQTKEELKSPDQLGKLGIQTKEIMQAVNIIDKYQQSCSQQIKYLEKRLLDIDQEINSVYGSMKQNPYYLHAILVHYGNSEGGHYYAFIFDKSTFKWYRFNDFKITEETEDKVFEESFGGNNKNTSAYGLVYVNHEIFTQQTKFSFEQYNKNLVELVPKEFKSEIQQDNFKFTDDVIKYQVEKMVKNIVDKYKIRQDKMNSFINSNQLETDLINFNAYIIKKYAKPKIAAW